MGTTAEKLQGILDSKAAIKSAIEAKGVTVGDAKLSEYAGKIGEIQHGGGLQEAPENDVNFYDYDGFRVASFTIAQAKALTAEQYAAIVPSSHEGLTFQEWNWTLTDIVAYKRKYIDIGANYITTDGKTHVHVEVNEVDVSIDFSFALQTLTVEWGDGSSDSQTVPDSTIVAKTFTHTYNNIGRYVIKISSNNSKGYTLNKNNWSKSVLIKEVNIGSYASYATNYALAYIPGFLLSNRSSNSGTSIRGFMNSSCPIVVVSKIASNTSFNGYYPFQSLCGKICFPPLLGSATSLGLYEYNTGNDRIILPEVSAGAFNSSCLDNAIYAKIISIPLSCTFTTALSFSKCVNLRELDIAQGWIPSLGINLSASTQWTAATMVDLFNKLGDRSSEGTSLTLTFGITNLDKLTADQKAIATNKGYTLA